MKIVFLLNIPFEKRYLKSFYVDSLLMNGYDVEIWDMSDYFKTSEIFGESTPEVEKFLTKISIIDLEKKLKVEGNEILLFTSFYPYPGNIKVFHLLKKYKVKNFYIQRGSLPSVQKISRFKFFGLAYNKIFTQLFLKTNYVKVPSVLFYTGFNRSKDDVKLIKINASDYDQVLARDFVEQDIPYEYAVFLDEFFPYHQDFDYLKMPKVDDVKYFKEMNALFDLVEQQLNVKVVIAGHPKSEYTVNPYNGREMIKWSTASLVEKSKMVISHASTSIGYAVIFKKPLVFACTSEMVEIYKDNIYPSSKNLSAKLGAKFVNAGQLAGVNLSSPIIDDVKYNEFENYYLKSSDSPPSSDQIIISELKKYGLRKKNEKN